MTRHTAHFNADGPLLRGLCLVFEGHRPHHDQRQQPVPGTVAKFPRRPDAGVLSKSIPLFFIGRNRNGFWIAREAEDDWWRLFVKAVGASLCAKEQRVRWMRDHVSRPPDRSRYRESRQPVGQRDRRGVQLGEPVHTGLSAAHPDRAEKSKNRLAMTQVQESEPPSWLRPPLFMVGQDQRGNRLYAEGRQSISNSHAVAGRSVSEV